MQKVKPFRSTKYLKWGSSLDCCMCGAPADEAHHIIGVGGMSGMGMKAPDWTTIPTCRGCHHKIHTTPELWERQWEWVAKTMAKAIEECWK